MDLNIAFEIMLPVDYWTHEHIGAPRDTIEKNVKYDQDFEEIIIGSFKLKRGDIVQSTLSALPIGYGEDEWITLFVQSGLYALKYDVESSNKKKEKLLELFKELMIHKAKKWVITFVPNFDLIENVVECGLDDTVDLIMESLFFDQKGYIIHSQSHKS